MCANSPAETRNTRPGLAVFNSLKAEDEPWLSDCYIPPQDFPLMAGGRSALIFGGIGAGKTALKLALEKSWLPPDQPPSLLLVNWHFNAAAAAAAGNTGTKQVQEQAGQVFGAIARALLEFLARHPSAWETAPDWAHDTIAWFAQKYFPGSLTHFIQSQETVFPPPGTALLQTIASAGPPAILSADSPISLIYSELADGLQRLGLFNVRIVVAGLEMWVPVNMPQLINLLDPFLTTLALFEHPRFAYTFILPVELQTSLWSAGSIARRRVDMYTLRWNVESLQQIAQSRLALALQKPDFSLGQLGPAKQLLVWLQGCGGSSPRGWLEAIRPFVVTYLEAASKGAISKPLSKKDCRMIQQRHPPSLYFNPQTGHATVGWRDVTDLQRGQAAILAHLYSQRGRVCTREKVYRAYLDGIDELAPDRLFPAEYANRLDNAILRLRKAIEPDPANPVFIITHKNSGLSLENTW